MSRDGFRAHFGRSLPSFERAERPVSKGVLVRLADDLADPLADLSHPPKKKARVLTNTGPFPQVALLLESVIHQEATQLLTP